MGSCYATAAQPELPSDVQYHRSLRLKITASNSSGRVTSCDRLSVVLNEPSTLFAERADIAGVEILVSACVLPGLDPHNTTTKPCQDGVFSISSSSSLLTCLFDGHGKEGQSVVSFCSSFLQSHFLSHLSDYSTDPSSALEQAFELCDMKVREEVDCTVSGT